MSSGPVHPLIHTVGRRSFLKVLGSSVPAAAVAACAPTSPERIISYAVPPEDAVPGVATWYATVCGECPAGCGMRVRTREGRAVKVEGNPEHPISRGQLCIRGQASLQGLYNPDRFPGPRGRRVTDTGGGHSVLEPIDWPDAEARVVEQIRTARERGRGRIALVTPHMTGMLDELVDQWAEAVGARRLVYEPFAFEATREANRRTFGISALPRYDFASPSLIASFGADPLETWLSSVEYSRDFAEGRRAGGDQRTRLIQIEPRFSLTAAAADEHVAVEPGSEGLLAAAMVHTILQENRVLVDVDESVTERVRALVQDHAPDRVSARTGVSAETITTLARRFSDPARGPGQSLAVGGGVASTGETTTSTLIAVNLLNYLAGNIGAAVVFDELASDTGEAPPWNRVGTHRDMQELAASLRRREIDLLLLHDVNPVYAMPGGADFAAAMADVPMVVATSSHPDETSQRADLVLPTHTPLESWGDSVPRPGMRGLMQPAMQPVLETKHLGDLLLDIGRRVGVDVSDGLPSGNFLEVLQTRWRTIGTPEGSDAEFETWWAAAQQRGGFWEPRPAAAVTLDASALDAPLRLDPGADSRPFALVVYPSLHFYDGRGANRPWLQEIPDAMTKGAWSSWAELSPETADAIGAAEGQLITVESDHGAVDATVVIDPNLRPGVVAMPLGQGHTDFGRFATGRGVNPTTLLDPTSEPSSGGPRWLGTRVDATARELRRPVPRLQTTFSQHDRGIAQAVRLDPLGNIPEPGEGEHTHSLYPDHPHPEHRWGMAIDLDSCTGCNACVAACYAENNVPVLGVEGARQGRTMSWLRIERFVERDRDAVDNRFVPMLCQQCDHAPCETVCPTYATYHTDEGLNAQVYNRCVGTRYCANNCPYKVRRFNWYNPDVPPPLNLQLNPDVTTRVAGVMEKCTFCVQRIREQQDHAQDEGRAVRDGDITPACAQTCPGQAIIFGDLNDPNSRVSQLAEDRRAYRVLESLNTRPAVSYLKKIRTT